MLTDPLEKPVVEKPSKEADENTDPQPTDGATSRLWNLWHRLVTWVCPPDVWTHARPSLREVVTYAREGAWTTEQGPYRAVGVVYGWVFAVPAVALAYMVAWLVERPTRAAAAFALTRLAWEVDQVRLAMAVATWPIQVLLTPVL